MYQRKDGLYEKIIRINGERKYFRGADPAAVEAAVKIAKAAALLPPAHLFPAVADEWEAAHFPTISYNTQSCYARPLADVKEHFKQDVKEITPLEIQRFIGSFKTQARQTVKLRLIVLKQVFDYAVLHAYVDINPCLAVKIPKGLKTSRRELPPDPEIEKVKQSADAPFGLFALICLYTGCRRNEALALRYEDIDRKAKQISISKALVWHDKTVEVSTPKTDAGVRIVPLLAPLAAVLPRKKTGYIFEEPRTEKWFRCQWKRYVKSTGVQLVPHQLRHGYATMLYDAGIDVKEAQRLLGHSKIEMTLDVYTHIKNSRGAASGAKIEKYLEGKVRSNVRSSADSSLNKAI